MKWQSEHRIPFLCLCSVPRPRAGAAFLTQNTSSSHIIRSGSSDFTAFAGSSGIAWYFFSKDGILEKYLDWIEQTLKYDHMVKIHPTSQHAVSECLLDSSSSVTHVHTSCLFPSMARSHLFLATVLDSVWCYNKDKLCSSDLVRLLQPPRSIHWCLGST